MNLGRMPACNILPFDGDHTASVPTIEKDSIENLINAQEKISGNRIGHDKNKFKRPRFVSSIRKRQPHSIEELNRRITKLVKSQQSCVTRRNARRMLFLDQVESNGVIDFVMSPIEKLLRHGYTSNIDTIGRRTRTECFEASVALVIPTLIRALDLTKMAIGRFDNRNKFIYYDYGYIKFETGLSDSRLYRVMKYLKKIGLVKVTIQNKQDLETGNWTSIPRIEMTDEIFKIFNLTEEFLTDRQTKAMKLSAKQRKLDDKKAKLNFYEKLKFDQKITKTYHKSSVNNSKITTNGSTITAKTTTPYKPQSAGNTATQMTLVKNYLAQGYSHKEAFEKALRSQAPPH